jgi:CubicO group peptidase (beta-lactamase class C family)
MAPHTSGGTKGDFAPLGERVRAGMARLQVPGIAIGMLYQGQEYAAGYGVTNVNHPLPVDTDTHFQIGSTTKTVTATAALRLVEQGRLDLDTPIRTYLPTLRLADESVAARVTLRHLFTHTGGWQGDYYGDTGAGDDALARAVEGMYHLPQLLPLGAYFSYNNTGVRLAGRVLEMVTDQTYEAATRTLVLEPLGMTRSFFFTDEVIADRVAVGHSVGEHGPKVARKWALPRAAHPSGGLISTLTDQLRYARFQLSDGIAENGARLLGAEWVAQMRTPQVPAGNGIDALGITWMLRDIDGVLIMQHGGATNGQHSAFMFVPSHGFALTILTNGNGGALLNREIVTWALEHYLGLKNHEPELLEVSTAVLAAYVGRYTASLTDLEVRHDGSTLIGQSIPKGGFPTLTSPPAPMPPPMRMTPVAPDGLLILDGPWKGATIDVLRQPDSRIMGLRVGYRVHLRQE